MIQYINEIILTLSALVIVDNFRGKVTTPVIRLLEEHNIHVCLLPPNTTDLLQPLDIAVNKPAKDYLKRRFKDWYSSEVTKQLQGISDIESAVIQPVDLSMAAIKERSAKWLVDMAEYIADNPQVIVHNFLHAGITYALDGEEAAESEGDSGDEPTDVISDDEDYDGGVENEGDNGAESTEVVSDDENVNDTNDMEEIL